MRPPHSTATWTRGEPDAWERARPVRRCGPGKRTARKGGTAPRPDPYYPAKVWLNGHEWAKRQAHRAGLGFAQLANGFASCEDPAALQAICDRFGPGDIQGFFHRWNSVIPTPFTAADKRAGYFYELSMRQVEVSRTIVFDDPRRARAFFEALVADNIGIGRPEEVRAVFIPTRRGKRPRCRLRPGSSAPAPTFISTSPISIPALSNT
jgi:hypothetical protein